MARTPSKQLEIKLDKNGQRRGGKRKGAGRPKSGARASEKHKKRPKLSAYEPVHVVMRACKGIGSRGLAAARTDRHALRPGDE
jgi:hypothetical protein